MDSTRQSSIEALKKLTDDYDLTMFHTKTTEGDVFFTIDNNIVSQYVVRANKQETSNSHSQKSDEPSSSSSF
ncbi:hypothetical protein J7L29_05830 [Candidatus Bathyarchaeota archaeon]|nr:hypothetical protein [Candidatus Bathyarchaeota archaeon]